MNEIDKIKSEAKFLAGKYTLIKPSLDFQKDIGYISIPVWTEDFKQKPIIITSEREKLEYDKEKLYEEKNLVPIIQPCILDDDSRWSPKHVDKFLDGFKPAPYKLFNDIRNILNIYVDFKEKYTADALALWIIGTYIYQIFGSFPYILLTGQKASGKTKSLSLISQLAFNFISANDISPSALFRLIDASRCSIGIDESEKLADSNRSHDFRELLNAGYKKGTSVFRVEDTKKDGYKVKRFEVYSPKAIANIKGLEEVLESRTIVFTMLRTTDKSKSNLNVSDTCENWAWLRHRLYSFALSYFLKIKDIYENDSDIKVVNGRELELWLPLLSLAKFVSKKNPEWFEGFKGFIIDKSKEATDNNLDDKTAILLMALRDLVLEDGEYSNKQVRGAMSVYMEDESDEIKSWWVGYQMKGFGFRNKSRDSSGIKYKLKKEDIEDLVSRYLPSV